ncbi:MAG TPA: ribosome maturation factor RimM [Gammaproteobacteria bacterium]|nr:ribosome maturation factor RimM [Gammaproteobacteria bacterium]
MNPIVLGKINGFYGVKGWVKIYSYTDPRQQIFTYPCWHIKVNEEWVKCEVAEWLERGKNLLARLSDYTNRDQATELLSVDIVIDRSELPESGAGGYYWTDLVGIEVFTEQKVYLGVIDHLFSTAANDVIVVRGERERLIPWLREEVITEVNLKEGWLIVNWDPDF